MMTDPDKELESLFTGLAPRQAPSEAARASAFAAAHDAFLQEKITRTRSRRIRLALAAIVIVTVMVGVEFSLQQQPFSVKIADAQALKVDGKLVDGLQRMIFVTSGTIMETQQPARLAVGRATDLRLKPLTSIRWLSDESFELQRGTVFIDTRDVDDMTVYTSRGTVTDIGTQFLVSLHGNVLEVAVRSGQAMIETARGKYPAQADGYQGDVLVISTDQVTSRSEPTNDERWNWIHTVPRGYEEIRVAVLLSEIARDLGLRLEYADPGVEASVMNLPLQGDSLHGFSPERALDVVVATSGLSVDRTSQQVLAVSLQ